MGVDDPYNEEIPVVLVIIGDETKERAKKDEIQAKSTSTFPTPRQDPQQSGRFFTRKADAHTERSFLQ